MAKKRPAWPTASTTLDRSLRNECSDDVGQNGNNGAAHSTKRSLPRRGKRVNVGAFDSPFSGVGMEFEPLEGKPAEANFVLHEVGYWGRNYDWNFESVFSPFWRIYYCFQPGHSVRFGSRETLLGPDRLVVIPSFRRFTTAGNDPAPSCWMAFSLDRCVEPGQTMPIVIPANETILGFMNEFRTLYRGRRQDRREAIYNTGVAFTLYVLAQPEIQWQAPLPEHIAAVLHLIQKHPAEPWTNATLARHAHMNTDAFARSFREWMHDTPAKYVQRIRVRRACALLAGSDLTIKQIAAEVGFANRHHFSRVFKDHTGISPARYRKEPSGE
ncbi:MAG: helix-turn-helix transcriptional regulator [Pirellulales bacterium]|nr:helix-turn-helix transcriptional regulator [Pirellulales bacterium]